MSEIDAGARGQAQGDQADQEAGCAAHQPRGQKVEAQFQGNGPGLGNEQEKPGRRGPVQGVPGQGQGAGGRVQVGEKKEVLAEDGQVGPGQGQQGGRRQVRQPGLPRPEQKRRVGEFHKGQRHAKRDQEHHPVDREKPQPAVGIEKAAPAGTGIFFRQDEGHVKARNDEKDLDGHVGVGEDQSADRAGVVDDHGCGQEKSHETHDPRLPRLCPPPSRLSGRDR